MDIWLIVSGEPLPHGGERPHRVGMLAEELANRGINVTWFTTTFDHQKKVYLHQGNTNIDISSNYNTRFLHSNFSYSNNVSLSRIINHYNVGREFGCESRRLRKPDLIFCAYPTIDLAYEAVKYGLSENVLVVIDVRDLWPNIFIDLVPSPFKFIGRLALFEYFRRAKFVFRNCYAITAVSNEYLNFGLRYGKRDKTKYDRVFPIGYKGIVVDSDQTKPLCKLSCQDLIDENKTIVWFVGTFGQTYDLSTVIDAASKLIDRHDIQFIFTGDGEKMQEWSALSKDLTNIIFTGWVGKNELAYLGKIANVGLMAYRKGAPQGLPNKVFEYLSFGLPILSSLQSETRQLLSDENVGMTYLAGNSGDFLYKLDCLLSDKDRLQNMSTRAYDLFESRFSANRVYNDMATYFTDEIIGECYV